MLSPEALSSNDPIQTIYELYVALARAAPLDAGNGLGGKLVFAGDLAGDPAGELRGELGGSASGSGSSLVYAANIAGAASLAASADAAVQRQAMRDGVIDFLVTSLEEALRILKNEIRKRQPVSVAVAVDPEQLVAQMLERGVLPDLLPAADPDFHWGQFVTQGARRILVSAGAGHDFVTWTVNSELARDFMQWLPRLDACAAAVIPQDDLVRRRWLRLAPRYLGRMAQRRRGLTLSGAELAQFGARMLMQQKDATGPVELKLESS